MHRLLVLNRNALSIAIALIMGSVLPAGAPGQSNIAIGLRKDPAIAAALRDISAANIRATDSVLSAFRTRHTMSDTISERRGAGAARRFLYSKLARYSVECGGCLKVEYHPTMIRVTEHPDKPLVNMVNVLAWLPGRDPKRVVVMGGHYDTCACNRTSADGKPVPLARYDALTDSPGADDDGSGTSAVVELARVFSRRFPKGLDATIIFALYTGEELGLYGSRALAERLHASGYTVAAAFTDDMVGNVQAGNGTIDSTTVRVFGADPDVGPSRDLARYAWAVGSIYVPKFKVMPVFRLDRVSRGGDHSPFVTLGDPGLRFSERFENYTRQHLPADEMGFVNFSYVANIARLNAAVVASIASAPPTPPSVSASRSSATGGNDWNFSWKPAAGAVGYEVLYRSTIAPTWETIIPVGNAISYTLAYQLDDGVGGVRSVGRNGERSIVIAVPPTCAPPRSPAAGAPTTGRSDSVSASRSGPVIDPMAPSNARVACVRLPGQ